MKVKELIKILNEIPPAYEITILSDDGFISSTIHNYKIVSAKEAIYLNIDINSDIEESVNRSIKSTED